MERTYTVEPAKTIIIIVSTITIRNRTQVHPTCALPKSAGTSFRLHTPLHEPVHCRAVLI